MLLSQILFSFKYWLKDTPIQIGNRQTRSDYRISVKNYGGFIQLQLESMYTVSLFGFK